MKDKKFIRGLKKQLRRGTWAYVIVSIISMAISIAFLLYILTRETVGFSLPILNTFPRW